MDDIWIAFSDCGAHVRMWSAEGPQKIADAGLNPLRFVQADASTPPADAALASHNSANAIDNAACVSNREADAALADEATAVAQMMETAKQNAFVVRVLRDCAAALRARPQAVAEEPMPSVPLSALVCVGRARFPRTGGNAGISWHVEDPLSDTGGFRSGSPCNGELLFVLPTTAKRAMIAASQSATHIRDRLAAEDAARPFHGRLP